MSFQQQLRWRLIYTGYRHTQISLLIYIYCTGTVYCQIFHVIHVKLKRPLSSFQHLFQWKYVQHTEEEVKFLSHNNDKSFDILLPITIIVWVDLYLASNVTNWYCPCLCWLSHLCFYHVPFPGMGIPKNRDCDWSTEEKLSCNWLQYF